MSTSAEENISMKDWFLGVGMLVVWLGGLIAYGYVAHLLDTSINPLIAITPMIVTGLLYGRLLRNLGKKATAEGARPHSLVLGLSAFSLLMICYIANDRSWWLGLLLFPLFWIPVLSIEAKENEGLMAYKAALLKNLHDCYHPLSVFVGLLIAGALTLILTHPTPKDPYVYEDWGLYASFAYAFIGILSVVMAWASDSNGSDEEPV